MQINNVTANTLQSNQISLQKKVNFKQNASLLANSLKDTKLINDSNLELTSRVLDKIGVKDIEYVIPKIQEATNKIFLKCKMFVYNMTLGKISDDLITGLVSKEYNNGKNELFAMRAEFVETNKAKKLQLSYMPVVQMGLESNSEIRPKNLKDITGNISRKTDIQEKVNEWQKTSESFSSSKILGGLLSSRETSSSDISPASISAQTLNNINIGIQLSNSDVKKNVTYSVDKTSNELSKTGASIGQYTIAKPKHSTWDMVMGPYGLIETPKAINITEEGIDPCSILCIIEAPLNGNRKDELWGVYPSVNSIRVTEVEKLLTSGFVKTPNQLKNLISILSRELNGETFAYRSGGANKAIFRAQYQIDNIRNLIEVARNLLRASEESIL